jgi:hypothetical protein
LVISDRTWTKLEEENLIFWLELISFGCIIYYAQFSCIVVCSWNAMDYGCFHKRFYGTFRALRKQSSRKERPKGLQCKVFLLVSVPILLKTTFNFTHLGVQNAPLGIIPDSVNTPLF